MNMSSVMSKENFGRKSALSAAVAGIALAAVLLLGPGLAVAKNNDGGYTGNQAGYSGPGPALVTVEQAKSMRDDDHVTLRGYIIQNVGGKNYVFKDDTGTVNVEISEKRWEGQQVGPDDLVEIQGEIDKDWTEFEIEVKRLIKL